MAAAHLLLAFYRSPAIADTKQAFRVSLAEDVYRPWLQNTIPGWSAQVAALARGEGDDGLKVADLDEFAKEAYLWGIHLSELAWIYGAYTAASRGSKTSQPEQNRRVAAVLKEYQKAYRHALQGARCAFPADEMVPLVAKAIQHATDGALDVFKLLFAPILEPDDALETAKNLHDHAVAVLRGEAQEALGDLLGDALDATHFLLPLSQLA